MKSERAVVGCILGVMVCLTGAMFFTCGQPDPRSLDQPVGPNTPMPPARKAAAVTPVTTGAADPWVEPQAPIWSGTSPAVLTTNSTISVPTNVKWSNPAAGFEQSGAAAPQSVSFEKAIQMSFNGAEGIVTLGTLTELAADADGDGQLTAADLDAFTDKWEAMGSDADFNGDGVVDAFDIASFVEAFESGESRAIARTNDLGNFHIRLTNVAGTDASEVRGLILQAIVATDEAK